MAAQESFTVSGITPDVVYARVQALNGLRSVLGPEPEELWEMMSAAYGIAEVEGDDGETERACRYSITFVRVREEVEA